MRIAAMINGLVFGILTLVGSVLISASIGIAESFSNGDAASDGLNVGAVGLLVAVALILGASLALECPPASAIFFVVSGILALLAARSGFALLGGTGVIALGCAGLVIFPSGRTFSRTGKRDDDTALASGRLRWRGRPETISRTPAPSDVQARFAAMARQNEEMKKKV